MNKKLKNDEFTKFSLLCVKSFLYFCNKITLQQSCNDAKLQIQNKHIFAFSLHREVKRPPDKKSSIDKCLISKQL